MANELKAKDLVSVGILLFVGYAFFANDGEEPKFRPWTNEIIEGEENKPLVVADQENLIKIAKAVANAHKSADNEIIEGQLRKKRGEAVCTILKGRFVKDWVGKVSGITSTSDGVDVRRINIDFEGVFGLEDSSRHKPGSQVHASLLSGISDGDMVTVSGELKYDHDEEASDCFYETSLILSSGMIYPEYRFKIKSISRIEKR